MDENPIVKKQKEWERWRATQQLLFSPNEIDEFRAQIKKEIDEISWSLRLTAITMKEELELIPYINKKMAEVLDRLSVIEMRFNSCFEHIEK